MGDTEEKKEEQVEVEDLDTDGEDVKGGAISRSIAGKAKRAGKQMRRGRELKDGVEQQIRRRSRG